jgi:hypothetical protein
MPDISVIMHTVRDTYPYPGQAKRHVIGSVYDDLSRETSINWELIVVDGVRGRVETWCGESTWRKGWSNYSHWHPISTVFTDAKKVAISAYKNTGLVYAQGELVVSIDDCCRLPPDFLQVCWAAHQAGVHLGFSFPGEGWRDQRLMGKHGWLNQRWAYPEEIFGFVTYPLAAALEVNGSDLAYDGSRRLEDMDLAIRLAAVGVKWALWRAPGMELCRPKGRIVPGAVDPIEPVVGCCNRAWQLQRVERKVIRANTADLWPRDQVRRLQGPCVYLLGDATCTHYENRSVKCPYLHQSWCSAEHPLAAQLYERPPVFDLVAARKEAGIQ